MFPLVLELAIRVLVLLMLLLLRAVKIAVTAIIRERFILLSHENLKYYIFLQLLRNILSTLSFLAFSFSFRKAILILINDKFNVGLISKLVLCQYSFDAYFQLFSTTSFEF